MRIDEIKRDIRQLKHLEEKLRFGGQRQEKGRLVWDSFFDTHDEDTGFARFPLRKLAAMSRDEYKSVVDEYFVDVYDALYNENGIVFPQGNYNPELLSKLGLPADAGEQEIKRRFRELAKIYHPDTGGDAAQFIELMDDYKNLLEKK